MRRPFPKRILFTGWFDTGKQGREWPGDFKIVAHQKPLTWDAAQSVLNEKTGRPWLRIHLRGRRPWDAKVRLRFRYRLTSGDAINIALVDSKTNATYQASATELVLNQWRETSVDFQIPDKGADRFADEIRLVVGKGAELLIDDLLLYVPGE
ncbi:MAG: hypothetical protein N2C14_16175 [Planctomycetales bacterium]